MTRAILWFVAFIATALLPAARAQTPAGPDSRELRILISHPPGGGYDTYGRLLSRHIGDHLPGKPRVIVQNMPGAAGIVMANHLASNAPRDGSVIALGPGSLATAALFGTKSVRYDARAFTWIGSLNSESGVAVAWKTAPVKIAADLFTQDFVVGAAGATDQSVLFPNALNRVLGTRFKVVAGYSGSSENALALERGEVSGIGAWNYASIAATRPEWLTNGSISILLQLALERRPELPNVPTVLELAKTDAQRAVLRLVFAQSTIGRVVLAPPGLDPAVSGALNDGFAAMLDDPEFRADAERSRIEINNPMTAPAVTQLIDTLHSADPALLREAGAAVSASGS